MRQLIYASLALLALGLTGCWPVSKRTGLVVVNVLDKELYDDCHIPDSINIPLDELEQKMDTIALDADLVFYCSNYQCTGSEYAAAKFIGRGFARVRIYEGGMAEWFQAGLPVEGQHLKAYLRKTSHKLEGQKELHIPTITLQELAHRMNVATAA